MNCQHDGCKSRAAWAVYAAYEDNSLLAHPTVARYPAALVSTCSAHLTWELGRDAASHASTNQWVVKPA